MISFTENAARYVSKLSNKLRRKLEEYSIRPADITVEDVARFVGCSYYHLTRQFNAVLGESVGSYIKGRRLADAAKKLLYTNGKVIDIAMEAGFDSSEAFSRAFTHRVKNLTVHPWIVEIPEIKAAGLRTVFGGHLSGGGQL